MKLSKKISIFFILLIMISLSTIFIVTKNKSKASEPELTQVKFTSSTEVFNEIAKCYNGGTKGPMMCVPGILNQDKTNKKTYLICLSGTESVENQSTNFKSDILSAFELENDYERNIMNHISDNIPKNSNIVFAGHSLGGMVAQQLSSNSDITDNYNVIGTVTYGSPLVSPLGKEGSLRRFIDKCDIVPYLSISNILTSINSTVASITNTTANYAYSKYIGIREAHFDSYKDNKVWKNYDVLGMKNGDASFTFYEENKEYYKCPILD